MCSQMMCFVKIFLRSLRPVPDYSYLKQIHSYLQNLQVDSQEATKAPLIQWITRDSPGSKNFPDRWLCCYSLSSLCVYRGFFPMNNISSEPDELCSVFVLCKVLLKFYFLTALGTGPEFFVLVLNQINYVVLFSVTMTVTRHIAVSPRTCITSRRNTFVGVE